MIPYSQSKGVYESYEMESKNSGNHNNKSNTNNVNLIRITVLMFNRAIINKDGNVTYNSKVIRDCMVVGYLIDYKELREYNKIIITLWDHTGQIRITFRYNSDDGFGIRHIEKKYPQPVQVIGRLQVHKQEKLFIGESVVKVKDISVFCHYFELIHEWLYLSKEYEKTHMLEKTNDPA